MWRFAVYTHKTTVLSKTCLKTVRLALKHTDGRSDYFRFLSNDATASASSMRIEKDQPVREVFSLDDFGLIRSNSVESMSSAGSEHTFLEQLFRNDTLNTFSNVQIPTTMSSKELGGSHDVFNYDYASELLSEGVAAEDVADVLSESSSDVEFYHDQQPSTSGLEVTELPFLIPEVPEVKENTRAVMSEKMRRERKLNLSTMPPATSSTTPSSEDTETHLFHIPNTSSSFQNVGELMFPESLPTDTYTSLWEGAAPEPAQSAASEVTASEVVAPEFSLDVIEGIITEGSMAELRKELDAVGVWPEYLFTGDKRLQARTGWILRFVAENSESYAEAEHIIKNFAASHVLAVIPDDVVIKMTSKSVSESSDVASITKTLEEWSTLSVTRELRPKKEFLEKQLAILYTAAIQKNAKTSPSILSLCSSLNYDTSAETFLNCYAEVQTASGDANFIKNFGAWKVLSQKYGSQQGIDKYWEMALKSEKNVAKNISTLLTHSGKSEHPFATMARMICTFVKLNEVEKASEVFQAVSVSGRHFKEPLMAFVEEKDLASIERLATLIERGMIAERRRGGKRAADKKTAVESEKPTLLLEEDVHAVLAKFYGVGGDGRKKKFVDKKLKKKIHRVDEEQLHELCKAIQKAWISCADGKESVSRLVQWCQNNRIEVDEKVQKKIDFSLKSH